MFIVRYAENIIINSLLCRKDYFYNPPSPCASWRVDPTTKLPTLQSSQSSNPGGGFTLPLPPPYRLGSDGCWRIGADSSAAATPRRLQDAPKTAPRRSKTVLRRSKTPQDASKTLQDTPETPQDTTKTPPRRLQDAILVDLGSQNGAKLVIKSHPEAMLS